MVKSPMIIYGKQVVLHALRRHPEQVHKIYIAKKGVLPQDLFEKYGDKITFIENRWAQQLSRGGNHQGLLAEIEDYRPASLAEVKEGDFVLVLDTLTDAGNIGAIVRSAYALGVDGIVATGIGQLNFSAVTRTSSGALLEMPFALHRNILDVLHELKQAGHRLYGASMEGEPIEEKLFDRKRTLVLGSEERGISKKARERLDETVAIRMKRPFDSLNVSAAAAIMIHRMSYAVE
ncbi:RNA methyltransferase, TrmH family, group 3 [Nitratifractor salsuginis DSM 16511]|uniref:RNA methyltransferase, TrmH family, group 3 n=2 Tax=Nitratifractor salsuginis TaxID=269261 RepID=E6X229_NITSE|nr:RNA methyltransferase, TrmH family, group 3 [Nitratifractor salsuginis DSM 16511]